MQRVAGRRDASPPVTLMARTEAGAERAADMRARHPVLTIGLHWGSLIAIVVSVGVMFARDSIDDTSMRQFLLQAHRQLGLVVLALAWIRIVARLKGRLADHSQGTSALMRFAAGANHVLLYGLLIALPVAGWASTGAHAIQLYFLGIIHLPQLVSADSELADTLSDYHVWLAWALLAAVGIHVAGALWHHIVRRDSVLVAMLPGRSHTSSGRGSEPANVCAGPRVAAPSFVED